MLLWVANQMQVFPIQTMRKAAKLTISFNYKAGFLPYIIAIKYRIWKLLVAMQFSTRLNVSLLQTLVLSAE